MKKLILLTAVVAALLYGAGGYKGLHPFAASQSVLAERPSGAQKSSPPAAETAFDERHSGRQVSGEGVVSKLLADDVDGGRHQRFILRLASGQTLLVAHNIDVAPRIASLKSGDAVAFSGVYEWNAKGGVVHWTHHDPGGKHEPGWLRHAGRTYQ